MDCFNQRISCKKGIKTRVETWRGFTVLYDELKFLLMNFILCCCCCVVTSALSLSSHAAGSGGSSHSNKMFTLSELATVAKVVMKSSSSSSSPPALQQQLTNSAADYSSRGSIRSFHTYSVFFLQQHLRVQTKTSILHSHKRHDSWKKNKILKTLHFLFKTCSKH